MPPHNPESRSQSDLVSLKNHDSLTPLLAGDAGQTLGNHFVFLRDLPAPLYERLLEQIQTPRNKNVAALRCKASKGGN